MRRTKWMVLPIAVVLASACGRNSSPAVDDALKNDLALASQMQPYNAQQFISPTEAGLAAQQLRASPAQPVVRRAAPAPVRRTSTARRSSGSSGGYYPAPAREPTVEKHTNRDAAIGAAAGAVIGAVSARDKVKGGLIGGAAGAIIGAVIGNNVDITRKP